MQHTLFYTPYCHKLKYLLTPSIGDHVEPRSSAKFKRHLTYNAPIPFQCWRNFCKFFLSMYEIVHSSAICTNKTLGKKINVHQEEMNEN